MSLINSKPLQGYKYGDFVTFKYNTIVYSKKGLPMFRDVVQKGWVRSSATLGGKIHVLPVDAKHDEYSHIRSLVIPVDNLVSKSRYNESKQYIKTTDEGFTVIKPVFDVPEGTPTYAGGNSPVQTDDTYYERIIPFEKETKHKVQKTTDLEDDIKKQKDMVNGKVKG